MSYLLITNKFSVKAAQFFVHNELVYCNINYLVIQNKALVIHNKGITYRFQRMTIQQRRITYHKALLF